MAILADLKDENGQPLATMLVGPKNFKTGSRGFYANGKIDFEGKRYQVQIQIDEIGSKPKEDDK